jgi:hypothetical protein
VGFTKDGTLSGAGELALFSEADADSAIDVLTTVIFQIRQTREGRNHKSSRRSYFNLALYDLTETLKLLHVRRVIRDVTRVSIGCRRITKRLESSSLAIIHGIGIVSATTSAPDEDFF